MLQLPSLLTRKRHLDTPFPCVRSSPVLNQCRIIVKIMSQAQAILADMDLTKPRLALEESGNAEVQ